MAWSRCPDEVRGRGRGKIFRKILPRPFEGSCRRPWQGAAVSNAVALGLGGLVLSLLLVDWLGSGGAGLVFAGRRLADLIEYLAFWR